MHPYWRETFFFSIARTVSYWYQVWLIHLLLAWFNFTSLSALKNFNGWLLFRKISIKMVSFPTYNIPYYTRELLFSGCHKYVAIYFMNKDLIWTNSKDNRYSFDHDQEGKSLRVHIYCLQTIRSNFYTYPGLSTWLSWPVCRNLWLIYCQWACGICQWEGVGTGTVGVNV
jgi:hypothetical protein